MSGTVTPTSDLSTFLGASPDAERVYDNVQARLSGVTLSMIKLELWNAIEQFCLESTYLRLDVNWQMAAGISSVDFNPIDANLVACWVLEQTGLTEFRVDPPATLVDLRQPLNARSGTAKLALKPAQFDESMAMLPCTIMSNFFQALLDGTLAKLYTMPAKPWSSLPLAQLHEQRFLRGIRVARDIADRRNGGQPQQWRFPYFAAGRRKQ